MKKYIIKDENKTYIVKAKTVEEALTKLKDSKDKVKYRAINTVTGKVIGEYGSEKYSLSIGGPKFEQWKKNMMKPNVHHHPIKIVKVSDVCKAKDGVININNLKMFIDKFEGKVTKKNAIETVIKFNSANDKKGFAEAMYKQRVPIDFETDKVVHILTENISGV